MARQPIEAGGDGGLGLRVAAVPGEDLLSLGRGTRADEARRGWVGFLLTEGEEGG
jgi:hypothetical protein